MPGPSSRVTVLDLLAMKERGEKITMLTAYDHTMAALLDGAGVDAILVGDSLSMVVQGHETTLPVTLDQMVYHAEQVGRAVNRSFVVVDMPFPTPHLEPHRVVEDAGRILKQTRYQAVKLEGGAQQADVIRHLVSAGIPVMAHVGLRPQSINVTGSYKVVRDEEQLTRDALAAEEAGAFAILMECIPSAAAERVTERLKVPTIGIGAGGGCDGQVLVVNDMLGLTSGYVPKFAKAYAALQETIGEAVSRYCEEVRSGQFPGNEHSFKGGRPKG